MQKYKQKIVQQDGGYVGYVLLNDEVIFTTDQCRDTVAASRQLAVFLSKQNASQKNNPSSASTPRPDPTVPVPPQRANSAIQFPPVTIRNQSSAPRRCCGRG